MNFDEVVDYIKLEGCRVSIYPTKHVLHGGNTGTFDYQYNRGPLIVLATQGHDVQDNVETLLHEFGHYLQWRDGFMQYLDGICDPYEIEEKWLKGKIQLSASENRTARNVMLSMEYDAETRGANQGILLKADHFDLKHYLQGAQAYMDAIKWIWKRRGSCAVPDRFSYSGKFLTHKELFAPLSEQKLAQLDAVTSPLCRVESR